MPTSASTATACSAPGTASLPGIRPSATDVDRARRAATAVHPDPDLRVASWFFPEATRSLRHDRQLTRSATPIPYPLSLIPDPLAGPDKTRGSDADQPGNRESGIGNQGIGNQESGIGNIAQPRTRPRPRTRTHLFNPFNPFKKKFNRSFLMPRPAMSPPHHALHACRHDADTSRLHAARAGDHSRGAGGALCFGTAGVH